MQNGVVDVHRTPLLLRLKPHIQIDVGGDAGNRAGVGVLPNGEVERRGGSFHIVLGQPHWIGSAQLGRETQQVALVSVEHGRVAGRGDDLAERAGVGGQLLAGEVVGPGALDLHGLVVVGDVGKGGAGGLGFAQVVQSEPGLLASLVFGQRLNPTWWPWYKPAGDTLDVSTLEHSEYAPMLLGKDRGLLDRDALEKAVVQFYSDQLKELGMTFDQFREEGIYQPGAHGFEYEKYAKGMLRFDGEPGFNTITGQIEAYSILYESWGEDPLPYYEEPNYSQFSKPEFAGQYPLITTSGSRRYSSFHSEHRQVPSLRQIDPWPWVQINPETAAEYGITKGDWVEVYNMFGSARFKAEITFCMKPGIINCAHGWWFPEQDGEEPNLFGVWKSNFNSLVPHMNIGKLGFGAPYKGVMCNMRRVRGLNQD